MKSWKNKGLPYLYNPNLIIGENKIDGINKDFAEFMEFEHWERCTNHSNRKLGITTAVSNAESGIQHIVMKASRHKDANTQKRYLKEGPQTMQAYSKAMMGKHVPSPTKSPDYKKKKPNQRNTLTKTNVATDTTSSHMANIDGSTIQMNEDTSTSTGTIDDVNNMQLKLIVPSDGASTKQQSTITNEESQQSYKNAITTYNNNDTFHSHSLPYVTPNESYRSIVTENHLSNYQRNIFFPQKYVPSDKIQQLNNQIEKLQQQLAEAERKKRTKKS